MALTWTYALTGLVSVLETAGQSSRAPANGWKTPLFELGPAALGRLDRATRRSLHPTQFLPFVPTLPIALNLPVPPLLFAPLDLFSHRFIFFVLSIFRSHFHAAPTPVSTHSRCSEKTSPPKGGRGERQETGSGLGLHGSCTTAQIPSELPRTFGTADLKT